MTRKITVETTYNGEDQKFSISNVNTNATDTQMEDMITDLMTLSQHTYVDAQVTDSYYLSEV